MASLLDAKTGTDADQLHSSVRLVRSFIAILARDPCWERAYRVMMTAHTRLGNRSLAMRCYQRCVEALRSELEVEPSPATTALYRQLLQSPSSSRAHTS